MDKLRKEVKIDMMLFSVMVLAFLLRSPAEKSSFVKDPSTCLSWTSRYRQWHKFVLSQFT